MNEQLKTVKKLQFQRQDEGCPLGVLAARLQSARLSSWHMLAFRELLFHQARSAAAALPAAGMDIKQACMAHIWDSSRTRLFACGGPLAFGLAGCYMAVWR